MTPREIVETMLREDHFSKWLGLTLIHIDQGYCKAHLTITKDMLNGMQMTHGGISYSLADSVLAFAANSRGQKAVSIETSISHLRPTFAGDQLNAEATEVHLGKTTAIYHVTVSNQEGKNVALLKGTVHRSSEDW